MRVVLTWDMYRQLMSYLHSLRLIKQAVECQEMFSLAHAKQPFARVSTLDVTISFINSINTMQYFPVHVSVISNSSSNHKYLLNRHVRESQFH